MSSYLGTPRTLCAHMGRQYTRYRPVSLTFSPESSYDWFDQAATAEERQRRVAAYEAMNKNWDNPLANELPWWLVMFGPQEMGVGVFWDALGVFAPLAEAYRANNPRTGM